MIAVPFWGRRRMARSLFLIFILLLSLKDPQKVTALSGIIMTQAVGGSSVSADAANGGESAVLVGPVFKEGAAGDIKSGIIMISAPAGFQFDQSYQAIIKITSNGTSTSNINHYASGTTVVATTTSSEITFKVTSQSSAINTLTYGNIHVKPAHGTPLASGNITASSTGAMLGLALPANVGALVEVSGIPAQLSFEQAPADTEIGSTLIPAVVVASKDQFGNVPTASIPITLSLSGEKTGLHGNMDASTVSGSATFSDLSMDTAGDDYALVAISPGLPPITSSSFSVSKKLVTPSVTVENKIYDGTVVAIATCALSGLLAEDEGGVACTASDSSFADKNAGITKMVTSSGISLSGARKDNYVLTSATATSFASISALPILPSVTVDDKVYDGTTDATISGCSIATRLSADDVACAGGSAVFDTKSAGEDKSVSITGLSLAGSGASNYVMESNTTAHAKISPRTLTISTQGVSKIYDGNLNATVALSTDAVSRDDVVATGTAAFDDKNVGTAKVITVSNIAVTGNDAANYTLVASAVTAKGDVFPYSLSISATADNKVYDGSSSTTVHLFSDALPDDDVTLQYDSAAFDDSSIGTSKSVHIGGIALSGADAGNYALSTASLIVSANITQNAGSVILDKSDLTRVYDGQPQSVLIASTTPEGVETSLTYNGSVTPPTDAGTYAVAATLADAAYSGFDSAVLTIVKADQAITFAALSDKHKDDEDFSVSATAESGLPVTFSSAGNCSVQNSTVHLVSAGACAITASQSGNANYNMASDVVHLFAILENVTSTSTVGTTTDSSTGTTSPTTATSTDTVEGISTTDREEIPVTTPPGRASSSTGTSFVESTSNTQGGGGWFIHESTTSVQGSVRPLGMHDFIQLMAEWGKTGRDGSADWNGDGVVDISDFIVLMSKWTS
jgi:hypothetical protein